jgi:hypothetical protein
LGWWTAWQGLHLAQTVGWVIGLMVVALQLRMHRRAPRGFLHFQSDGWLWEPDGHQAMPIQVQVVLDWQSGLLLRLSAGDVRWLWLERGLAPLQWLDLRRAVWGHSH